MSKHICLVPKEWDYYYSSTTIEVILKKEITCDQVSKKIGGVGINLNGVTAFLHYWNEQPWMKKVADKRTYPNPKEYFGVYMSCNNCRKPTPCWIPREWLAFPWDSLQVILSSAILNYYLKYGRIEGSVVRINGVTARLQLHSDNLWMRNDLDLETQPNLKDYFSFLIPCIHCNTLNKLNIR